MAKDPEFPTGDSHAQSKSTKRKNRLDQTVERRADHFAACARDEGVILRSLETKLNLLVDVFAACGFILPACPPPSAPAGKSWKPNAKAHDFVPTAEKSNDFNEMSYGDQSAVGTHNQHVGKYNGNGDQTVAGGTQMEIVLNELVQHAGEACSKKDKCPVEEHVSEQVVDDITDKLSQIDTSQAMLSEVDAEISHLEASKTNFEKSLVAFESSGHFDNLLASFRAPRFDMEFSNLMGQWYALDEEPPSFQEQVVGNGGMPVATDPPAQRPPRAAELFHPSGKDERRVDKKTCPKFSGCFLGKIIPFVVVCRFASQDSLSMDNVLDVAKSCGDVEHVDWSTTNGEEFMKFRIEGKEAANALCKSTARVQNDAGKSV